MHNNASEEPLVPAGEAAPTPVSIPADSVAEAADQLEKVNLSNQDEARPPEDPDLWKPHAPTEECPACMVPLPLENGNCTYWACCSKRLCAACCKEHDRALLVTNRKRHKKKQPPLEKTCAFCRIPIHKNDVELVSRHEKNIAKDDSRAMFNLAGMYLQGDKGLRKDEVKAFELLQLAAGQGCAEAIGQLGFFAVDGQPDSIPDQTKANEYFEKAAAKGHSLSRVALADILAQEGEIELAIKHWHLAAAAGFDHTTKYLWDCFSKGKLSKSDLEKALRAHKAASDEMKSEERERFAAYKKAKAGNDQLLKDIYTIYYGGFMNAKELKKALQAHRHGNRREATMLIKNKILAAGVDIESLVEQARLEGSS